MSEENTQQQPAEYIDDNANQLVNMGKKQNTVSGEYVPEPTDKPEDYAPKSDRPEWLPEKFKSAEDMAKAYQELEKKLSTPTTDEPVETKAKETETKEPELDETEKRRKEIEEFVAGYHQKLAGDGLDEKDIKAIAEKTGYHEAHVKEYAEFAKVAYKFQTERDAFLLEEIGGKDQFEKIKTWADKAYDKDLLKVYNDTMINGSLNDQIAAVRKVRKAYENAHGGLEGNLMGDTSSSGAPSDIFLDDYEAAKAINDPRYHKSDSYRKYVEAKIARTARYNSKR